MVETLRPAIRGRIFWGGLLGLALLTVLIAVSNSGSKLGVYWLFGLAFGFVLQRSRFCFASAFRDLFLLQQGRNLIGIVAGLGVSTIGFGIIMSTLSPNPALGTLPFGAHIHPVGPSTVVGGLLFGIGMVLAGGCTSGSLYRMGEGYVASWVAVGGMLLGLFALSHSWNWWWDIAIGRSPMVWLPASLSYPLAIAGTLVALLIIYLGVVWLETREGLFLVPERSAGSTPSFTFTDRLASLWHSVFVRGWPVVFGGVALGVLNVFLYISDHPWGIVGEISRWADGIAGLLGLSAGPLKGTDQVSGCTLVQAEGGLLTTGLMLNVGMIAGSFTAAYLAGEFKIRLPKGKKRYIQSLVGGILMGYGAGLAIGCTIGAFFSAVPSLALSGWLFAASLAAGAYIGVQLIKRLP